ncbi:hypothetical protein C5S32_09525 [ANME-1 cluster archaeon GoMg1]|nr:hypothetical protein [ANME-1 cluster archaeon GoMg1]
MLAKKESELIRRFNGLRNAVVHKYNQLDLDAVRRGLNKIEVLYEVLDKLVGAIERKGALEGK